EVVKSVKKTQQIFRRYPKTSKENQSCQKHPKKRWYHSCSRIQNTREDSKTSEDNRSCQNEITVTISVAYRRSQKTFRRHPNIDEAAKMARNRCDDSYTLTNEIAKTAEDNRSCQKRRKISTNIPKVLEDLQKNRNCQKHPKK